MNEIVQYSDRQYLQNSPWNLTNQNPNHDNAFLYMLIPSATHIFSHRLQH